MNKPLFAGLGLIALLFLVWPIAHTTSLRELLLWSGLVLFCRLTWNSRPHAFSVSLRLPFGFFFGLTLWLIVVALLVSAETAWSLEEIQGQWLKGVAALVLGGCAGLVAIRDETARSWLPSVLVAPLAVYVIYSDLPLLSAVIQGGTVPLRLPVLGSGPDKANYVTNLFLAFVLAEMYLRAHDGRRTLRVNSTVLGALFLFGLLAEYANSMRNGMAELVVLILLLALLFLVERVHRLSPYKVFVVSGALIVIIGIAGVVSYRSDPRWQTFSDTVTVAWDIDKYEHWRDPAVRGYPQLSDGRPVEASAYLRVTALRSGFRLIVANPLGIGFGRNAYGHALNAQYGDRGLGHSHSGMVDLAIGAGIPGAILWLVFLASLFVIGWRRFRESREYAPLLLMLVVTGYGFRMLVDSVIRDHMLQQFLLLAGLLAVMSAAQRPQASA
jgi:hypothetical protein